MTKFPVFTRILHLKFKSVTFCSTNLHISILCQMPSADFCIVIMFIPEITATAEVEIITQSHIQALFMSIAVF